MKRILTIVSMIAIVSLSIYACKNKDEVRPDTSSTNSSSARLSSLREETLDDACTDCCTTAVQNGSVINDQGLTAMQSGVYGNWDTFEKNLCTDGPQIRFEGQFDSFIAGQNGWNVGVLNSSSFAYSTTLSSITNCTDVKNAIIAGTGNKVGETTMGNPGYYTYNSMSHQYNLTNLVAVWKCCTDGPNTGKVKMYIIKVTNIIPTEDSGLYGTEVYYDYKCLWCTVDCPS